MFWKSTVQDPPVLIPEGTYYASPFEISETQAKYGPITIIYFSISTNDEFDGQEVNGICSSTLNEKSKLGKWSAAIMNRILTVGEELKGEDILHKNCRVVIKHNTNDNDTLFANVVDVLSAEERTIDE